MAAVSREEGARILASLAQAPQPSSLELRIDVAAQSVFTEFYSRNGLTPSQKMAKQFQLARLAPIATKCILDPFIVDPPRICDGQNCPGYTYSPLEIGVAQIQGGRDYQEDNFLLRTSISFSWHGSQLEAEIFGVFDGHCDQLRASSHIKDNLKSELEQIFHRAAAEFPGELTEEIITNALVQVFHNLALSYQENPDNEGGTTVTCAFSIGDKIYFPNIGDSRALLVTPQRAIRMTEDAIVSNPRFLTWHNKRDHEPFIDEQGTWRIHTHHPKDLGLMMGRDVGANPEMCDRAKIIRLNKGKERDKISKSLVFAGVKEKFLVLATDGLYEVATIEEIANAIRTLTEQHVPLADIARILTDKAGEWPDIDNVTVMIVALG